MRVLVATDDTQGQDPGDYHWAVDGELVTVLVTECGRPDECGCGRGFPGLASARATTTAMVVELDHMDRAIMRTALRDGLQRQGWLEGLRDQEADALVDHHITAIELVCVQCSVGAVVRRDGTEVWTMRAAA